MSGSTRAITLTLSVRDADSVKQSLQQIGPAGEQALARLEAAAQKAAGRGGSGGMAQLATTTQQAGTQFRGMGQTVTQAGFQLQDFTVQVQSGTSALTALSQQGSQFLGMFGPAGAMAGAALAIGLVAIQFLTIGENAEQANKRTEASFKGMADAARDVKNVLAEINSLFLTASQRAAAAANAQVGTLREDTRRLLDIAVQRNEGNAAEATQAQRDISATQRALSDLRGANTRAGRQVNPGLENILTARLAQQQSRLDGLGQDTSRQSERIGELNAALSRLDNAGIISQGGEEFGPPNPDTAEARAAARRGAAAAARAAREREVLNQAAYGADVRGDTQDLRDYAAALRAVETPMERYTRRVEELSELQVRLQEAGTPMRPEDDARIFGAIQKELQEAESRTGAASSAARELGMTFSSAFEDAIIKGKELSDVLQGVAEDLARIILRQTVINPLAGAAGDAAKAAGSWIGSLISGGSGGATGATYGAGGYTGAGPFTASANGNAFANGRLIPFASGGMVDRATVVPMALMGEAGPEAIMPLRRGKDGKLGVAASGGGGDVVQHITIDARGSDPSVVPLIQAAMLEAKRQAKAELLAEIQRGGQAAKVVGRR